MGVRFRKSFGLGKGVRLNLSKGGLGLSVGGKGMRLGIGPRGAYRSLGIPGTGLYAIDYLGKKGTNKSKTTRSNNNVKSQNDMPTPEELRISSIYKWVIGLSVLFIFIYPIAGVTGLVLGIFWYLKLSKTSKYRAYKSFVAGKKALEKQDYSLAISSFEAVSEYQNITIINLLLAYLYTNESNFDQANVYFEKYLELKPDDYETSKSYAVSLLKSGKPELAIPILQKLPQEMKEKVEVINLLASCFLESNKPELALEVLEKGPVRARKMDEEIKAFRFLLGLTYKELGDKTKALKQFQKVYAEDVEFMDVKELMGELG